MTTKLPTRYGALLACTVTGLIVSVACSGSSSSGAGSNTGGSCEGGSASGGGLMALCCREYQPGTNLLDDSFTGVASANAQFAIFAQASGDLQTVAEGSVFDVTAACRAIALDLGDMTSPEGKQGADLMNFWCGEAATKITTTLSASAGTSLNISFEPTVCSASVSAAGACQARCSLGGTCDITASPPTCLGGSLVASCMGACTGTAGTSIDCAGSCSGNCSGACTATGGVGVDCEGKCAGTCAAKAGVGNGRGAQADGTCQGSCSGTCTYSASAPAQLCTGQCSGKCDGTCSAQGGTAAECSGACMGTATPLWCKGGTLQGGCSVDPNCQANCNASATARAQCAQPMLTITANGNATPPIARLMSTLQTNLPSMLVVAKERGMAFASLIAQVQSSGSATFSGGLDAKGAACLTQIVPGLAQAAADFPMAISSALTVLGAVGIQ